MRGIILAAGRGQRMGSLTDNTPKPLLKVRGRWLIEYAIASFVEAGIRDIVVNVSWHADQIREALGTGDRYGVRFHYSFEPEALETGGGILNAMPFLGRDPFVVMSADIILEHALRNLCVPEQSQAHIILAPNPSFHLRGDFSLDGNRVIPRESVTFTYASVGIFSPDFFAGRAISRFPLGPMLDEAVGRRQITGEVCAGKWWNVGTPELLQAAENSLFFSDSPLG